VSFRYKYKRLVAGWLGTAHIGVIL
jgi:hypothetical protein